MHYISTTKKSRFLNYPQKRWELFSVRRKCFALCGVWRDAMDWRTKRKNRVRPPGRTLPKATDNSDMYSRAFPVGNALFFFAGGVMSLLCLPCGKLSLAFLAVPAGKDGWVECPCQTVNDFIGIRGSVGGLFLFVQTHAPLTVPPWQSRARKSKLQSLSGARARMLSALLLRLVAR